MKFLFKFLMLTSLFVPAAFAQRDGVPVFGAADVHESDAIDLATLTPSINIPLISKPGAFPFSYTLTSQSSCSVVGSGANAYLSCRQGSRFGGFAPSLAGSNLVYTKVSQVLCNANYVPSYSAWYLFASDGLDAHPINPSTALDACHTTFSQYTTDGSGFLINITSILGGGQWGNGTITSANGHTATLAQGAPAASDTDTFNNSITVSGSQPLVYTDTLGASIDANLGATNYAGTTNVLWTDTTGTQQQVYFTLGSQETFSTNGGTCGHNDSAIMYPLAKLTYPDGTTMSFGMEQGYTGSGTTTGRINYVKLRTGATVTYTYSDPCTFIKTGSASLTRNTLDGTTTYTTSLANGIATTTVLDPGKNKTVYYFSMPATYAKASFLVGKDIYQNTGTVSSPVYSLLQSVTVCYNTNQTNCRSAAVSYPISQRDTYTSVGTMTTSSRVSETFDTTYGNRLSVASYDFGASTPTITTSTTYGSWNGSKCVNVGSNVFDHPCDVVSTGGAETRYTYNAAGALTTLNRWTGSRWLKTTSIPNANGTVQSSTNANNLTTNYGYSGICNSLLPTSTSTTLNGQVLATSENWDCNGGVVTSATDVNNNSVSYTYDPIFRQASYSDPYNYTTTFGYITEDIGIRTPPKSVDFAWSASFGSSVQNGVVYPDGLGRPLVAQAQQGPGSANYDTVSYAYAFNGPNWQVTTTSPCTAAKSYLCPSTPATISAVDPLWRPISTTDSFGGTLSYSYNSGSNRVDVSATLGPKPTGENSVKTAQREFDGLGRLVSVCGLETSGGTACGQIDGGSGILTSYTYTYGANSLTVKSMRGSQVHTTVYDALGRVTSETTPEAGTKTYTWDYVSNCGGYAYTSYGAVVMTQDANGNVGCYAYDTADRLLGYLISPNSTVSNCPNYIYGDQSYTPPTGVTINNGSGRLVEASIASNCEGTTSVDEWFSYDKNGRVTDVWESTPHSGGYYHTSVVYNPNGSPASLSGIPGYGTFNFGVDGEGRPSTATVGSTTLVNGVTYDAASNPLTVSVGGAGDSDTYAYDANERMTSYSFSANSVTDNGTLTWNPNGTLGSLAIVDGFNAGGSQTCSFLYDDIIRELTDNCGSSLWNQTYSYDPYDNLTKVGNPGTTWQPGYNPSNNRITGASYDNDGHVTYDFNNTYTWSAYGKMVGADPGTNSAVCGTTGNCFTYDAQGSMVEKSTGSSYYEMLYSPLGCVAMMSGQTAVTIGVPMPGGSRVWNTGSGYLYDHTDWLGSVRLSTNVSTRTKVFDAAYTPYGELYNSFGSVRENFTGDIQASIAGLFDTPNRELDQIAGSRWLSPDPAHASWNAYAYVTNPNREIDPTGLDGYQVDGCGDGYNVCDEQDNGGPSFEDQIADFQDLVFRSGQDKGLTNCYAGFGCGQLAGMAFASAQTDNSILYLRMVYGITYGLPNGNSLGLNQGGASSSWGSADPFTNILEEANNALGMGGASVAEDERLTGLAQGVMMAGSSEFQAGEAFGRPINGSVAEGLHPGVSGPSLGDYTRTWTSSQLGDPRVRMGMYSIGDGDIDPRTLWSVMTGKDPDWMVKAMDRQGVLFPDNPAIQLQLPDAGFILIK